MGELVLPGKEGKIMRTVLWLGAWKPWDPRPWGSPHRDVAPQP